jgi:hypothetical protein
MNTITKSIRKRSKPKQYANDNIIEALRSIPGGVASSGLNLAKDTINPDNWSRYIGIGEKEKNQKEKFAGDLTPGQELDLATLEQKKQDRILDIDPGYDYKGEILHREIRASQRLSQETENNITQILVELKKLVSTTRELKTQFKEVAVEKVVNPGKYHESFFEWMLSSVKEALKKVEDSGAWLSAVKGKNAKRGIYWTNADETVGGTSFSLSSERVVATQTG